jgi:hypothetical protein
MARRMSSYRLQSCSSVRGAAPICGVRDAAAIWGRRPADASFFASSQAWAVNVVDTLRCFSSVSAHLQSNPDHRPLGIPGRRSLPACVPAPNETKHTRCVLLLG